MVPGRVVPAWCMTIFHAPFSSRLNPFVAASSACISPPACEARWSPDAKNCSRSIRESQSPRASPPSDVASEMASEMICSASLFEGYKTLVTAKGLGGLRPNTVMLAWPKEIATDGAGLSAEEEEQYCSLLKHVALAKKTLLICKFGVR